MDEVRIRLLDAALGRTALFQWHVPGIVQHVRWHRKHGRKVTLDFSGIEVVTANFAHNLVEGLAADLASGGVTLENIPVMMEPALRRLLAEGKVEVDLCYTDSDAFVKVDGLTAIKRFKRYYEQNRESIDRAIVDNRIFRLYDPAMGLLIEVSRFNPDEPDPTGLVRFHEIDAVLPEHF